MRLSKIRRVKMETVLIAVIVGALITGYVLFMADVHRRGPEK